MPKNISVENNRGVLGTTTTTYNEAGVTYQQAGQIYGGGDSVDGAVPTIIEIKEE